MTRLSIRLRLAVWYSMVLLLALGLFGGGLWFTFGQRLVSGVDARLAQRVDGLRTVLEVESEIKTPDDLPAELAEFAREVPEGNLIELRHSSGKVILAGSRKPFFNGQPVSDERRYSTAVQDGRPYRILTTRIFFGHDRYDVLVASSLDEVNAMMDTLRSLLLLMTPVVLLVAGFGGVWISRRALAPVDEITRVAKSISVRNLSQRLPVPRTGDEIQRMSEAWNEVLERLDGAVKRIRQFTADASHELRTPVALIRTTAELALRRERTAAEYRDSLSQIQNEAEQMTGLTESLLTLARSDSGGAELTVASTDLNDVVRSVLRQAESDATAKGIALVAEIAKQPATATADAAAIQRLLLALIDNALKHTPRGGTVTVSTTHADGGVLLRVIDTGEGIHPDALPHIFERFFRADVARGGGSGAGLGLAIAQAIAEAHHSHIDVESTPGMGSRFELVLRK